MPLRVVDTSEQCNSFVLVAKSNEKMTLCIDLAKLSQALMRLVHRGPPVNDILPRHVHVNFLALIHPSLWYHNLKLDEKSSYLINFMSVLWVQICKATIWNHTHI